MGGRTTRIAVLVITTVIALLGPAVSAARADSGGLKRCEVSDGRSPQTATPEEVGLDSAALRRAIAFAADPTRLTVRVFRNNCLIASGPDSDRYARLAWNMWSSTKSVVSLLTGIAADEGRLRIDDPIDAYLPPGLGDAAHRAITVRSLLTETSGMQVAVASEGITGLAQLDPNVVAQAMAMPIRYPQGTVWQYSQRAIDLLAAVVQRAVGADLQDYAQRKLFAPLGIPRSDWYWGRDRSGNTYGYAHLMLPADDFVKLGLLIANRGSWHGIRVVSAEYLGEASRPTATNPCYGFLLVVNGPGCGVHFPGLPPDAVQMSGMMRQDNFIVPSLGLLVSWTGITVPGSALSFPHEVLRGIEAAFLEPRLPDPGPYVQQPDISLADPMISNPDATLAALGIGPNAYPGCGPLTCLGKPLAPPFGDWPPGCFIVGCVGSDPATPGIR
ncbi:beta-lactamase family protein [Nocardia sp. CDC159]|uniref:Beta-lactamase family protein n=1 Tax=Nocardia pulmonis TaxID=2951408 RepID=A0A9X2IXU9_9NOCA|nr:MULTISPECIES: serine hydrolase [Nocardia]MCM6776392.1 beta-lactamase family protein [Nocardia pulmonis]MCM6788816.1 beta-lactamase family protein [Nocardia sp. CDC159]